MKSIKLKVLLAQICLSVLVSFIIGFSSYLVASRLFLEGARETLLLIATEEGIELSQRMNDYRRLFREVAREELMEFSQPEFRGAGLVLHFAHFTDSFSALSFAGPDGMEQARMVDKKVISELSDLGGERLFQDALGSPGSLVVTDIREGLGGDPVVRLAYGVSTGSGSSLGVILGELPLSEIASPMLGFAMDDRGQMALVEGDGTVLHYGERERLMSPVPEWEQSGGAVIDEVRRGKAVFRRVTLFGKDGYVAFAPVPGYDWAVLAILPYHQAVAGPLAMRNTVFFITLGIMLLVCLLSLWMAEGITRPLRALAAAADSVAGGDFTGRIDAGGEDEVGRLGESFNRMSGELERSYRELERQNEELKKMDRIKDSLVTDITHELKTPVAKHGMQLEILKNLLTRGDAPAAALEACGVMEKNIMRQQETIRSLLVLSRLEREERETREEEVDLEEVLGKVLRENRHVFEAHGIRLETDLQSLKITSDRELLFLTVSILIDNAVKYRGEKEPLVEVSAREAGGGVEMVVRDNGIGMTREDQEKVFERFYQATASASGTGVGLSLAKMAVERLGGTLKIFSAGVGLGTSATVSLPGIVKP